MAAFHFFMASADETALVREFHELQADCYARYGAAAAVAPLPPHNEVRYLVVARDSRMVAGIRFHPRRSGVPLPLEDYFRDDPNVHEELEVRTPEGIAELCGLWSRSEVARSGIGGYIVGAAVAVAPDYGFRHLCSFAHQFNRFTRKVGFEPDVRIGEHPYPDARYRSTVNWCDAVTFPTADPEVRARILWLRAQASRAAGAPLPLGFHPPRRVEVPVRRIMSSTVTKSRPIHEPSEVVVTRLSPDICAVETATVPEDARDLIAAWPSILGPTPPDAKVICVRRDDGELLSTVAVSQAAASPLGKVFAPRSLDRTYYLSDLAWSDGAQAFAPHALYMGVRRARIEGATTIAAHAKDSASALDATLKLRRIDGPIEDDRVPQAQRLDLAAHTAYRAIVDVGAELDPGVFGDEVYETFHVWLRDLYSRGFFRAVEERALSREQYVYTISNMHQFVRWTTRLLGHAVAHAHHRSLRNHFLAHLHGEMNHETIIERDLTHLGEDVQFVVDRMAPSPGTRQFMAVQESLAGMHHDLIQFLASPLAAEGIASHLTPGFLTAMEENIASWGIQEPRRAMTFLTSHVHTDGGEDGHWEMVLRVIREHLRSEDDVRRFLGTLRASTGALTIAYDEFVEDLTLFERPRLQMTASAA